VTRLRLWRFRELFGEDCELPGYFVTAQSLSPAEHVAVQAVAQAYIDSLDLEDDQLPAAHLVRRFQGRVPHGL
jgi:hypothetical protein